MYSVQSMGVHVYICIAGAYFVFELLNMLRAF